jgi:hypothetical protein
MFHCVKNQYIKSSVLVKLLINNMHNTILSDLIMSFYSYL